MKKTLQKYDWLKLTIIVLLLLNLALTANQKAEAAPEGYAHSDRWLLNQARHYISVDNGLMAAEYLRAFIEREPSLLKNNSSWSDYYENKLKSIEYTVQRQVSYGKSVQTDLARCGRYDCENSQFRVQQSNTGSTSSVQGIYLSPMPDEVVFFDGPNCTGRWVSKTIGTYNSAEEIGLRNDSIVGVLVGGGVAVKMCMHGSLTGSCATFTSSNCNLTNHWIGYQVTSAQVYSR
jgi:hypothetical protein